MYVSGEHLAKVIVTPASFCSELAGSPTRTLQGVRPGRHDHEVDDQGQDDQPDVPQRFVDLLSGQAHTHIQQARNDEDDDAKIRQHL
jgi:hypothetical protein